MEQKELEYIQSRKLLQQKNPDGTFKCKFCGMIYAGKNAHPPTIPGKSHFCKSPIINVNRHTTQGKSVHDAMEAAVGKGLSYMDTLLFNI